MSDSPHDADWFRSLSGSDRPDNVSGQRNTFRPEGIDTIAEVHPKVDNGYIFGG